MLQGKMVLMHIQRCCSALQCVVAMCRSRKMMRILAVCSFLQPQAPSFILCCRALLIHFQRCIVYSTGCCSVFQYVAVWFFLRPLTVSSTRWDFSDTSLEMPQVCCSALQCVAVCCNVLQCTADCCSVLPYIIRLFDTCSEISSVCCSVLQCVAVCCSVLKCVAVYSCVLQCTAVCCNVMQCVALFEKTCRIHLQKYCQCVAVCFSVL